MSDSDIYIIQIASSQKQAKNNDQIDQQGHMFVFPQNTSIAVLRVKLKEVWPDFNFLNYQTAKEIYSVSENNMTTYIVKDIINKKNEKEVKQKHVKIKILPSKEDIEKKKKQNEQKKAKDSVKWAIIKDKEGNFTQKLRFNDKTKLIDLRESILSNKPDDSQDFNFLSSDGHSISKSSESGALVTDLVDEKEDQTISISFKKPSKEKISKKQKKEQQEKMKKAQKTKDEVNKMIDELDEFEKKYKKEGEDREIAKTKKLRQLEDRLSGLDISFKFTSSTDISDVIRKLTDVKEQNAQFINRLQELADWTINQLAARYSNSICTSKNNIKAIKYNIVDFANSSFEYDWNLNTLVSEDFSYSTQDQQTNHINSIQSAMNGADIAVMGGNPFFFVKAGASYDNSSQTISSDVTKKEYRNYYKNFFALFIGMGIKLYEDNIYVKANVLKQFQGLYQLYDSNKKTFSEELKKRAFQFRKKYGTHIETGTYYLGNTFLAQVEVHFQNSQHLYMAQTVAQTALDISIAGGGISQEGFGAATATFSRRTSSALAVGSEQFSEKFTTLTHNSSFPPIQNFQQWKNVVSTKNRFWKIITKNVSDVSILKLLLSPSSLARSSVLSSKPMNDIDKFSEQLISSWDREKFVEQQNHTQFKDQALVNIANQIGSYNSISASRIKNITIKQLSPVHLLNIQGKKQIRLEVRH